MLKINCFIIILISQIFLFGENNQYINNSIKNDSIIKEKQINNIEAVSVQTVTGILGGGFGALCLGGFGYLFTLNAGGLGVLPGAAFGYTLGNSISIYMISEEFNKRGNLPLTIISETAVMGLLIFAWIKSYDIAMDNMSRENYLVFSNKTLPAIGISFCVCIPTITGILTNNLTHKHR